MGRDTDRRGAFIEHHCIRHRVIGTVGVVVKMCTVLVSHIKVASVYDHIAIDLLNTALPDLCDDIGQIPGAERGVAVPFDNQVSLQFP